MRALFVALTLFAGLATAAPKPKAKPKPPAGAPAEAAPAAVPAAAPAAAAKPAAPAADAAEPSAALLARVRSLYSALEYDKVIPLAERLVAREDLSIDDRLDAYRLYGSAVAIVQDPIDAEKPFRLLLRSRPDYELPAETPPKILAVFRKVQTEEKALANQLKEVERARIIAGLKLIGEPPESAKGGRPLPFSFRLRDATGAVEAIRVPYRRAGVPTYSALALERNEEGDWRAQIPGEFTSDEKGFSLEYYVETVDAQGPLLTMGSAAAPRKVAVAAGTVSQARPPPLPRWAFFTGVGLTAAAGATAAGFGIAFRQTQSQYTAMVTPPPGMETLTVDGRELATLESRGNTYATATTVALITTAALALITAIMIPFTNWSNE